MSDYEREQPVVSIIIPSWFAPGQDGKYGKNETYWMAQECLRLMIERTPRAFYELIIIDNGSNLYLGPDEGDIDTDSYFYNDNIDILIRNKKNLGFGPACNQGFNVARGKYIVCMNNDIIVWEGWLDALINVFDQPLSPPAGVVMPALMKDTKDFYEASKIENPVFKDNVGKWSPGAEFGSLWMMKHDLMAKIKDMNATVVDDKKIDSGYVFDENFKLGMGEDRWLWQQVRQLGFDTYRCHETRVFHQGNMTISKVPNRKEFTFPNREYLEKLKKGVK